MIVNFVPLPVFKSPQGMYGCGIALFVGQRYIDTIMFLGSRLTASDEAAFKLASQMCHALASWLDNGHNEKRLNEFLAMVGDHCRKKMFAAVRPDEVPWPD